MSANNVTRMLCVVHWDPQICFQPEVVLSMDTEIKSLVLEYKLLRVEIKL